MDELMEKLKSSPIFRNIPESVLQTQILPHGKRIDVPKNGTVIQYQELVEHFSVVISGKLHILHSFEDGTYSIFHVLRSADVAGVDLLWTGSRLAPYFVTAAETSVILRFPASIMEILEPQWKFQVVENALKMVSHENMRKEYRLAILSRKGLRERILTYLSMQCARRHMKTFTIPFSREELSSFLCVNRSAMCHELSLMQQEGLIQFRKNEFTLCNCESIGIPE